MDEFRITITAQDDKILKIRWAHQPAGSTRFLSFLAYNIDFGMAKRRAEAVRNRLAALVQQCMDGEGGGARRAGAELKALADAGRELYDTLFLDAGGEQDVVAVEDFFKSVAASTISVSVDNRVHIPWGLIWDGASPPSGASDDVTFEHYADFWCVKHRLSTVYRRVTEDRVRRPMPLNSFVLLPIVNRTVFDRVTKSLGTTLEKEWFASVFGRYAPVYKAADFETEWKANASRIGLLYFYCHANGTELAFDADRLNSDRLRLCFAGARIGKRDWSCLLFLSGCSTATGDPSGAFLEAAGEEGIGGFIGTEAEVPDLFAMRFGLEFLKLFLRGVPIADVIARMRARHFPLSLIYSVYTYPLMQVERDAAELAECDLADVNFSLEQLGTERL